MEIFEKLFGGAGRVKVMRLFLFNPEKTYDREEVATRTRIDPLIASRELSKLSAAGLIRRKRFIKEIPIDKKNGGEARRATRKKRSDGWQLNSEFPYLIPLGNLLIDLAMFNQDGVIEKVRAAGKLKLVILSGIFIQDDTSRVDLFVVGDTLKRGALDTAVKQIEAEIGKEVRYAAFETDDYLYRLSVYDKLVRDILDFPHTTILDRLPIKK